MDLYGVNKTLFDLLPCVLERPARMQVRTAATLSLLAVAESAARRARDLGAAAELAKETRYYRWLQSIQGQERVFYCLLRSGVSAWATRAGTA